MPINAISQSRKRNRVVAANHRSSYSCSKAATGSTLVARQAGTKQGGSPTDGGDGVTSICRTTAFVTCWTCKEIVIDCTTTPSTVLAAICDSDWNQYTDTCV
jgi:hypothetical protein